MSNKLLFGLVFVCFNLSFTIFPCKHSSSLGHSSHPINNSKLEFLFHPPYLHYLDKLAALSTKTNIFPVHFLVHLELWGMTPVWPMRCSNVTRSISNPSHISSRPQFTMFTCPIKSLVMAHTGTLCNNRIMEMCSQHILWFDDQAKSGHICPQRWVIIYAWTQYKGKLVIILTDP